MIFDKAPAYWWEDLSDQELLKLPLKSLGLKIKGTQVERALKRLQRELNRRGLKIQPKAWVSTEWFCPDGFAGFAIPFYLFHQRLERLWRRHVGLSEGRTAQEFMMILRHECGHLVDNAYGLRRSPLRRKVFGLSSTPYPRSYEAKPYSKKFVKHLKGSYAQAHPDEDFAETFAVWLGPKTSWRRAYSGWPALAKLEALDQLLSEKRSQRPLPLCKQLVSPLDDLPWTVGGLMRMKQKSWTERSFFERDLNELFSKAPHPAGSPAPLDAAADRFVRKYKEELTREVSQQTGIERYKVQTAMSQILKSCRQRNLMLKFSKRETKAQLTKILTERVPRFVQNGHHRMLM